MHPLIKPRKLAPGSKVATLSISGGRAGDPDMMERYLVGKKRLEDVFGLQVIETQHSLMGQEFICQNPAARVADLHQALQDPEIHGIIANMGGDDSYRLLPYVDFDIIRKNPKVFVGYSDLSTSHNIFTCAGVSSFYGPQFVNTHRAARFLRCVHREMDAQSTVFVRNHWRSRTMQTIYKD